MTVTINIRGGKAKQKAQATSDISALKAPEELPNLKTLLQDKSFSSRTTFTNIEEKKEMLASRKHYFREVMVELGALAAPVRSITLDSLPNSQFTHNKKVKVIRNEDNVVDENIEIIPRSEDLYAPIENGESGKWKREEHIHMLELAADKYKLTIDGAIIFQDKDAGTLVSYSSYGRNYEIFLGSGHESDLGETESSAFGDPFIIPLL